MKYTIQINDNSKKAKSIINMLKALKEDYSFIEILENRNTDLEFKIENELEKRYKLFLENSEGKEWNVLKNEIK